MTMGFKSPPGGLPKNVAVGDAVKFELRVLKDGAFEITTISPTAAGPAQDMKDMKDEGANGAMKDGMNRPGITMPSKAPGTAK